MVYYNNLYGCICTDDQRQEVEEHGKTVVNNDIKETDEEVVASCSDETTDVVKRPVENDDVATSANFPCSPSLSQSNVQANNDRDTARNVDAATAAAEAVSKSNDDDSSDSHGMKNDVLNVGCVRDLINSAIEKNLQQSEIITVSPSGLNHMLC